MAEAERPAALARAFQEIFELYLRREWGQALERLRALRKDFPDDYVTELYIDRCERAAKLEPDASWDGVLHLDSK